MKRALLIACLACALTLACACAPADFLRSDVQEALPPVSAAQGNADVLTATLYFPYLDSGMLTAESRMLVVSRDESAEAVLIQALLDGPGAASPDLERLFEQDVKLMGVRSQEDLLYVTFSSELLEQPQSGAEQAQQSRTLALEAVVASVTECFDYTAVQFMISGSQGDTRLDYGYLSTGLSGPSDPLTRNESLLLTPHNTAAALMAAWQTRDFDALYAYTYNRPLYEAFLSGLNPCLSLTSYNVSPGSVSPDGRQAVVTLTLTVSDESGSRLLDAYPLRLKRDSGVWKADYEALQALMSR